MNKNWGDGLPSNKTYEAWNKEKKGGSGG